MSSNEEIIKKQIAAKMNLDAPYFCPTFVFRGVQTDIHEFPYKRFFRGRPDASHPTVWDREAGYQEIQAKAPPKQIPRSQSLTTDLTFQYPCSTVWPARKTECVYYSP